MKSTNIPKNSHLTFKGSLILSILCTFFSANGFAQDTEEYRVLFFGDSITAGYGLDESKAYPAVMQQRADSLGLDVRFVNAGLSGETSAGGLRRINWVAQQDIDVFVLELGGNDGLRGLSTEETYENLSKILEAVNAKHPNAELVVAGMQVPPNMGPDYSKAFADIYPRLAQKHDAHLIPFILEGVGGIKELNQPDGIHPTAEGHRIVAELVWEELAFLFTQ
jgi:acyl-CoA thioesterase-1